MRKQKIKWKEPEMVEMERSDECLSLGPINGASLKRFQWPHEHMRAAAGARRWGQRQEQGKRVRGRRGREERVEGAYRREGWPLLFSLGSSHVKVVGTVFLILFKGGKGKRHVSWRFKRRAHRLKCFPLIKDDGASFFFFFPSPPDPFMRIHIFFKRARKEAVFFCFFPRIFFYFASGRENF